MEHLDLIELDGEELHDFKSTMIANLLDGTKDILSLFAPSGRVIAIAGINHLRLGVCEAWIIRGKGIDDHKFDFFKTIKGLIEFVFEYMDIHRFEIAILNSWEKGHKWAQTLGLEFEHICKSYDSLKRDHAIYTRII